MNKIFIEKGDITEQKVDAIINPANSELLHGGGLAAYIVEKGGQVIQEQSNIISPIPLGEATVTEGGKLAAKYVIHGASMELGQLTTEANLRKCLKNCLLRASELEIKSLAIPAIGTGVGQFPFEQFANIAIDEVNNFIKSNQIIKKIIFILHTDENYKKFVDIINTK